MRRNSIFTAAEQAEEFLSRRSRGERNRTRRLDVEDMEDIHRAGNIRRRRPTSPASNRQLVRELKKRNAVRWYRLRSDYKWASRQLTKMGHDPSILEQLLDG